MNDVEQAGTQLPADASILWGNEMDAYENRIPIHYSKGYAFWEGRVILAISRACSRNVILVNARGGRDNVLIHLP